MSKSKLTAAVKQQLQDLLAADVPKEQIAKRLGISKVTLYAWIALLNEELQQAVAARKEEQGAALVQRQFNLFDELAEKATMLGEEIAALRTMQRQDPSAQTAQAIFRGAAVAKHYLDRMGELLGQLQPPPQATVQLTRIEHLLNVSVTQDQVPDHLRPVIAGGGHGAR